MTSPPLHALRNLGPKSQAMLAAVGITTLGELRLTGAVGAYVRLKRAGVPVSLNLLWAMEGALTNRPWQEVARDDRLRLLLDIDAQEGKG